MKRIKQQLGSSIVEFVVVGACAAIIFFGFVTSDNNTGVIQNLQEHERRQINNLSAP